MRTGTLGFAITAILCVTLGACASDPPDPDLARTFTPVQTHQIDDLKLDCGALSGDIHEIENDISILDKQIKSDQSSGESFSLAGMLGSVAGQFANNPVSAQLDNAQAIIGNAGAADMSTHAMTKQQLRANYQQRHDALIQIYFARRCTTS